MVDDFSNICRILGVDLGVNEPRFRGFYSQGDGASWAGTYRPERLDFVSHTHVPVYDRAPAEIRSYAPQDGELHRIADELCLLARIYYPTFADVSRIHDRYAHEMTMHLSSTEPYVGGGWVDWSDLEAPDEIICTVEDTLLDLFRDLARWLYRQLETEYDYLTSDEAVAETLEANEIFETEDEE